MMRNGSCRREPRDHTSRDRASAAPRRCVGATATLAGEFEDPGPRTTLSGERDASALDARRESFWRKARLLFSFVLNLLRSQSDGDIQTINVFG